MQRNYSIDILKALCAFLVIILHVAWAYTDTFLPLARAAVPVFFMISGYHSLGHTPFHRLERTDVAGAEPPPFHPFHC